MQNTSGCDVRTPCSSGETFVLGTCTPYLIGHYRGTETLSYEVVNLEKDIGGTIFDQLARIESYLSANTYHGMTLSETSYQRVEVHEYPQAVIRELGVNMIAHRDYANFLSSCQVQKFKNRISWVSPGGLPPGMPSKTFSPPRHHGARISSRSSTRRVMSKPLGRDSTPWYVC